MSIPQVPEVGQIVPNLRNSCYRRIDVSTLDNIFGYYLSDNVFLTSKLDGRDNQE